MFPKTLAFCTILYVKVKGNLIKFLDNASSREHTQEHACPHTRDTKLSNAISLDKAIMYYSRETKSLL
jgi:hypothetical protein